MHSNIALLLRRYFFLYLLSDFNIKFEMNVRTNRIAVSL